MNVTEVPKPKKGFIIVKKLKRPSISTTQAGILVPENKELNLFEKAEVLAVGGDLEDYKMETKVGDIVIVLASHVALSNRGLVLNGGDPLYLVREESGFYAWV